MGKGLSSTTPSVLPSSSKNRDKEADTCPCGHKGWIEQWTFADSCLPLSPGL